MKLNEVFRITLGPILLLAASSCGQSGSSSATSGLPNGPQLPVLSGNNVMTMTVDGSTCNSATAYQNKPCVSVTVCPPNVKASSLPNATCQTINDILLDTGSYGLRLFASQITTAGLASSFTPVTVGGNQVAECVKYADGSADWGPVNIANLVLANEPAIQVPIQLIESTYANSATYCSSSADSSPQQAGFNGILGVGLFAQDCGTKCVTQGGNQLYFTCASSAPSATCTSTALSLSLQVTNPVALLPIDNNGVIIELPSLPDSGSPNAGGYVVLGIGTESNNTPTGVTAFSVDPAVGEFDVNFNGHDYPNSFIDSGSNGIFFEPPTSLFPDCGTSNSSLVGWFCPAQTESFQATTTAATGIPSSLVPFNIGNLVNLLSQDNQLNFAFANIGGSIGGGTTSFDLGAPFYFGRNVYIGLENTNSALGTGPYWAY